jgi:hypothetical protein
VLYQYGVERLLERYNGMQPKRKRRKMSAKSRTKIAAAQRARLEKVQSKAGYYLSFKIAADLRARWTHSQDSEGYPRESRLAWEIKFGHLRKIVEFAQ